MGWLIPTDSFGVYLLAALTAAVASAVAVVVHYEGVYWLARRYSRRKVDLTGDRGTMLKIIFALLGLHIIEIWCFGLAYWGLLHVPGAGSVAGVGGVESLFDAFYLSASTFTTLGLGDLAPVGAIRVLSGCEALTGLLLITWSASFTYLEMARLWNERDGS